MLKLLKKYWDILGGTAMGLGLSFATQWQLSKMQLAYTTIILILVSIGLLKVIKSSFNSKGLIGKMVEHQSPVRAIKIAQNPTQEGEELGELVIETMKGGKKTMTKIKNFFKRVWGNKFTLINITINLLCVAVADYLVFSEYLLRFNFFTENQIAFKIGVPVLSALYLVLDIFTTVSKYGWENLDELKAKSQKKATEKASKLSKEQKAIIKNQIKVVENGIATLENELNDALDIIKNFEILQSLNGVITISADKHSMYHNAIGNKPILEAQISEYKLQLSQLKEALK